jgi:hypothetical protein
MRTFRRNNHVEAQKTLSAGKTDQVSLEPKEATKTTTPWNLLQGAVSKELPGTVLAKFEPVRIKKSRLRVDFRK